MNTILNSSCGTSLHSVMSFGMHMEIVNNGQRSGSIMIHAGDFVKKSCNFNQNLEISSI